MLAGGASTNQVTACPSQGREPLGGAAVPVDLRLTPMADVTFVPDVAGWEHAFKMKDGLLGSWLTEVTGDVAAVCRFEAPGPGKTPRNRTGINYGKGVLMNRITDRVESGVVGELEGHVVAVPEHAKFVIHGTAPHVIKPRKPGGRLRFFWFKKGRWAVFRHVNHPGTAANDFLVRGLKKGMAANGLT